SVLTPAQHDDLRRAVAQYLDAHGLVRTAATLREEAALQDAAAGAAAAAAAATPDAVPDLLEKKWLGVLRLQRKVMALEAQLAAGASSSSPTAAAAAAATAAAAAAGAEWRPPVGPPRLLEGHRSAVTHVAFHPKAPVVATASEDATIKLWDAETGAFERTLKGHTKAVTAVAFDAAGRRLASASADLCLKVWDAADAYACAKTLYGHDHAVSAVVFTPDGRQLVSASRDGTVKVWDAATTFCVHTLRDPGADSAWVRSVDVAVMAGQPYVLSGGHDQAVRLWALDGGGRCELTLTGHAHVVEAVVFLPATCNRHVRTLTRQPLHARPAPGDETVQYAASASRDRVIKLWDLVAGTCVHTFVGHDSWVRALRVAAPTALVSGGDDGTLRVWDL
ncbi:hypothetical protein CXG81DRAFT_1662, partial [Caulochytrium protostelioides]